MQTEITFDQDLLTAVDNNATRLPTKSRLKNLLMHEHLKFDYYFAELHIINSTLEYKMIK